MLYPLNNKYGHVPKVLLLGNGINRAYDYASWDDLIESIRTKDLTEEEKECMKNVPYPLQPVILTGDHLGTGMSEIAESLAALRADPEEETLLRAIASLPADAILTTNYTYELEKALEPRARFRPGKPNRFRTTAYAEAGKYDTRQLHTYFSVMEGVAPIWHIHGEAARPDTMVIGHYYYGKLLSKLQQHVSSAIVRHKITSARQSDMEMRSWLDYFLTGDVHIVGLGMSLSEMDLWWLVNCKKRNFPDTKVTLYKPDIRPEEKLLAEAYGVTVVTDGLVDNDYKAYYKALIPHLQMILADRN